MRQTNTASIISAVCAVLGWAALPALLCLGVVPFVGLCAMPVLLAVPALFTIGAVAGHLALARLRTSGETGKGLAIACLLANYIGLVVCVLGVVAVVFLFDFPAVT